MKLTIASTWDGRPLAAGEVAEVRYSVENDELTVLVESPFADDPPPPRSAGSTDRLWEYEVVELFLVGDGERYLEIELGPHGHYFVLELHGARNPVRTGLAIRYEAEIVGNRWRGVAIVPLTYVPPHVRRANAFRIHGKAADRHYLAAAPVPGPAPDFHRLEAFPRIEWPPARLPTP